MATAGSRRGRSFLDGLSWPTGIVPYDGGVFVAVVPDILYAKDTNGDGVADVKKVMFSGFATDNVQGLLNGLLWGPGRLDLWRYEHQWRHDREPHRGRRRSQPVRGRDFRFKPDGSQFEAISGGGQFGHSFDDWGHRFTCNNSNHIRQVVLPSHYLERNPRDPACGRSSTSRPKGRPRRSSESARRSRGGLFVPASARADPVMLAPAASTERFAIGFFTSATGVTIYRGTAYPAAYRGNAFIGDVGGNLVHRKMLPGRRGPIRPRGPMPEVEFLASTDNWFRPVNFANTPDGTLLDPRHVPRDDRAPLSRFLSRSSATST